MDGARSRGRSRAPATSTTTTSSRSGSRSSACSRIAAGTRTSSTRPPSSTPTSASTTCASRCPSPFIVGATGRQTSRMDNGDGTTTLPLSRRGRPRLRVDGEPRLHRPDADVHAPDAAAGRDAAAAAARAPRPGGALLRRHRSGVEALRRMVRRVSLRPRDGRRPGVPEPGRRHGVPDVLHRPRPLAPVSARARRRR